MKNLAKIILPKSCVSIIRNIYLLYKRNKIRHVFKKMYIEDMLRYLKYSRTLGNDTPTKMIGAIILQYHVIEKGLIMPESRVGFGKDRIISLIKTCLKYIEKYGQNDEQLNHAIGVIMEYEEFHKNKDFVLDKEIAISIMQLKNSLKKEIIKTYQISTTRKEYFMNINTSFYEFSNSRSSIRQYTAEDVPLTKIHNSLNLARNAPSACNRQSWRTYIYTDKEMIIQILESQGGNRGFGHLTNKLIIITGELGVYSYTNERNQVFIDGGIYAMNLLYALHYNKLAACILNCSFNFKKEQEIKDLARIKETEVLIAMITCGIAPDEFKITVSPRYNIEKTNTIII